MTKRRNFADKFTAAVALEALRGDKTVQEIARPSASWWARGSGRRSKDIAMCGGSVLKSVYLALSMRVSDTVTH